MARQTVADYITDWLTAHGVDRVFLLTGGALTYLVDAIGKRDDIDYVCVAHEQAAAMAADGFSRVRPGSIGVALTTSGPGATNLITGTGCSWFDSIPVLYISGQVNTYESRQGRPVRQIGFQEMEVAQMLETVTKFAYRLEEAAEIGWVLDKAWHLAKSGRPGPAFVDVPFNIQRTEIETDDLPTYTPPEPEGPQGAELDALIARAGEMVKAAQRPIILAGGGVRGADGADDLRRLARAIGAPVAVSMNGLDAFPSDDPLYAGFIGVYGHRGANFAVANSDLLIGVGTRLDSRQTGTRPETFAREAQRIIVDIDGDELASLRVEPDLAVQADAGVFCGLLVDSLTGAELPDWSAWRERVTRWTTEMPADEGRRRGAGVDPYFMYHTLSGLMADDDVVTLDTGQNMVWGCQALKLKAGQRAFTAGGMSPMGYSFPAAIGVSVARGGGRVIAVNGDGGMQINLQELITIKTYDLPVKVIVANNDSLGLIRQFQDVYFEGRNEASVPGKGYAAPDFAALARVYGIDAWTVDNQADLAAALTEMLAAPGPGLMDVKLRPGALVEPKLIVNRPIEDQDPPLDRETLAGRMVIEPLVVEED